MRLAFGTWIAAFLAPVLAAQKVLTWADAKQELRSRNPDLQAGAVEIQESKADEITAYLRPNPQLTFSVDQLNIFNVAPYRPFINALPLVEGDYLVERQHKRELRKESAQKSTRIAIADLADQERNLLFKLRNSFVAVLQQKAIVNLTKANLAYYDGVLRVSQQRLTVGDIAQVDLDRLELQRLQFETDVETASVTLRTAKIQLLQMLNDQTPVERLDAVGSFDFVELPIGLEELRKLAFANRPDLRAAIQAVDKSQTDHRLAVARGSTDPTIAVDVARETDLRTYVGVSVSFPVRIFDRNQGEKARTQLDIQRNERLSDSVRAEVLSNVDSAFAALQGTLALLRPYKARYLQQAARVRETISFSYQHGGASLLDFLQAQEDFRNIQLTYLNLVGSYFNAANQLNLAVGLEVAP